MRILVLFYSHTGNNRRFAQRLAARLQADAVEVAPKGWRTFISVVRDMSKKRRPAIRPLAVDPGDYDHTVLVAPVWDYRVANPLVTAIEMLKGRIGAYSFATLCGYVREGQEEKLRAELTGLVGHPPDAVTQAFVGSLLPEAQRGNVFKVSGRRVKAAEMGRFAPGIEEIAKRLSA